MDNTIQDFAKKLEEYFTNYDHAVIAYSGGVDSALLAYTAYQVLGEKMVAVIADSSSFARREYQFALDFAKAHNIPLKIMHTNEIADPHYNANESNRCYLCRKAMFEQLKTLCGEFKDTFSGSSNNIFCGTNVDDLGDYRPGIQAAKEASILSPYIELGIDKNTIREVSRHHGLQTADKPAMPCLSTRIPYGQQITLEKLHQVEQAEQVLYNLGLHVCRVRHHGDTARIEIGHQDFSLLIKNREHVSKKFHELGFTFISMDLDGFKSGSLNTVLES